MRWSDRSFREKTAWIMLALLVVLGGFYAWEMVGAALAQGGVPPPSFKLAWVYVGLLVVGAVVGMSALAVAEPKEATRAADERERVILDRAGHWSGYVLAAPVVMGVLVYYVHRDGDVLFHAVTAGLMLSQIAEYALQVTLFRRGV